MKDLDSEIGELFAKQGFVRSEGEYRFQVEKAAKELFKRQPPGVNLPIAAFTAIVVSMLKDYRLPLKDVQKRIFKGPQNLVRS